MYEVNDKYPTGKASLADQMLKPTSHWALNCPNMAGNQGPFVLKLLETYSDGTAVLYMLANRVEHRVLGKMYNYSGQTFAAFPLRDIATRMAMTRTGGKAERCDSIKISLSNMQAEMQSALVGESEVAVDYRMHRMRKFGCDM